MEREVANCGCVYHAEQGVPCEHDLALADTRERLLWDLVEFVEFVRDRHGLEVAHRLTERARALGVLNEERP